MDLSILQTVKVIAPTVFSFAVGMLITPTIANFLYKNKLWKKEVKSRTIDGRATPVFQKLHGDKEIGTPKMGGTIIWASAIITTLLFALYSYLLPEDGAVNLNFLSRDQTWLPLFTLFAGAIVGLIDDYFEVSGKFDYLAGGLSLRKRLLIVLGIAVVGAWWFFIKLDMTSVSIPFVGPVEIGIWFVPLFIVTMVSVYAGGVIDGIDGLAGGVFASMFSAYGVIAFAQNQINLAALCFVIVGAILAFLWFNTPPARFYMAETGTMALTITLAVIAFLTRQVLVLPIIAFPLVATVASDLIQLASKRFRNKKVFRIAPIHHHFEAIGWSSERVTMRYWIVSVIMAILGVIVALLGA